MDTRISASKVWLAFVCAMVPTAARAEGEPVKIAATARFDLTGDSRTGSLENGRVVAGNGTVVRMNWVSQADQPRGYTVSLPVTHVGWRSLAIEFTPARSGTVTLTMMGPWEEASKGVIYREEVLWDEIKAEGASLSGGGFESSVGGQSAPWQSAGGSIVRQSTDVPAVAGSHYARTWHNQTLFTRFDVTGGRAVTISLFARAARPAGFREMRRIEGRSSQAHQAANRFLRGANLANSLEAPPGQDWGAHHSAMDLRLIKNEGFDHVRIPIAWHHYTGSAPEFRIKPEIFARVDELVVAGLREKLGVLIDIHHFDDFTSSPTAQTAKFDAIWAQLAAHYARSPESLAFELLNEPKDAATTDVLNPIFANTIKIIRKTNLSRTIFVGPGRWNSIGELPNLRLPDEDENLIVTVHNYEPFFFTHQGATWSGPDTKVTGILFPGPPLEPLVPDPRLKLGSSVINWLKAYNNEPRVSNPSSRHAFLGAIEQAREWSDYFGRPVHVGEFGCFTTADGASRAHYYQSFREAAERARIGWAIWDWKSGFHYWNEQAGRPEPGMRQALFGKAQAGSPR
jgi:endoglucanase